MLRADNTTVIVLALQERGGLPIPMHRDEIVVDMAMGIDHVPYPGTPYNTCKVVKVSAVTLLQQSISSGSTIEHSERYFPNAKLVTVQFYLNYLKTTLDGTICRICS